MPKITSNSPDEGLFAPNLIDSPRAGGNAPEFTVSDLSKQLKRMVEDSFGHVRVRGEIGECKLHSSGHLYLSLKDENAVLAAVCWRGQVARLGLKPAMGMEVVCTGKLTTFAGQSKYQLVVESMSLAGVGALLKMLEERRLRLQAKGLFDPANKLPLPYLPRVIGVVTSPTGAVIRDILHRLEDRFPCHVLLWPVPVQGEGAAQKIADAIQGFNALDSNGPIPTPDVLIVARGGGSLEDLMPFNEEVVLWAAYLSDIPVISAVGHETDTTLLDYVADLRAPTPTAAAEMVVPVRDDLLSYVDEIELRLDNAMRRTLRERKDRIGLLGKALGDPLRAIAPLMQRFDMTSERFVIARVNYFTRLRSRVAEAGGRLRHPRDIVRLAVQRLDALSQKMRSTGRERLMQSEKKLERLGVMLEALSPRAVLGRGYGLIYDAQGHVITKSAAMKKADSIRIELHDGSRKAIVEE